MRLACWLLVYAFAKTGAMLFGWLEDVALERIKGGEPKDGE